MERITSKPIPLGAPTVTRAILRDENEEAVPLSDVVTIHARAFTGDEAAPFWIHDYTPSDLMTEEPSTVGWTIDDVGYTFKHKLLYGADGYYPPLGRVYIEYVLRLVDGALPPITREVDYEPGRAVFGGSVVP